MNWSGTSKSCSRSEAIADCRSSRFLPGDAELVSLHLVLDTFEAEALDVLPDLACLVGRDADVHGRRLAHTSLRCFLHLAVGEELQRDLALHQLFLEHLDECLEPVLAGRRELDRRLLQLDRAVGALEIEAGRDFPRGLIDGIADFLLVDFGDDIERRHGGNSLGMCVERAANVAPGRYPRGQRGRAVNPLRYRYVGSNPTRPTTADTSVTRARRLGSEQSLHEHDVEPATELSADFALGADRLEPAARMERDRRFVIADDARDRGVKSVRGAQAHQLVQQGRADARTPALPARRRPSPRPWSSTRRAAGTGSTIRSPAPRRRRRSPRSRDGHRSARRATRPGLRCCAERGRT